MNINLAQHYSNIVEQISYTTQRLLIIFFLSVLSCTGAASEVTTTRVSVDSDGNQATVLYEGSGQPSISQDGRYVCFESDAADLVDDDTNGYSDIFVHDTLLHITTRVSLDSYGFQANYGGTNPTISANGQYVAFDSSSTNLVSDDTNNTRDIFVNNRETGVTIRVSVNSNGDETSSHSFRPAVSANGCQVAFYSTDGNLVSQDDNSSYDVFVNDCETGETTRVSVDSSGVESNGESMIPAISADGRFVLFQSDATNLVTPNLISGRHIYVHDRQFEQTTLVSVDSDGNKANSTCDYAAISGDGRIVAFRSSADNLVEGDTNGTTDIFVQDRLSGETTRVSVGIDGQESNGRSSSPSLSYTGRYIAFGSSSDNLVSDDSNGLGDIFVYDRETDTTVRVSVDSDGYEANSWSYVSEISDDARYVAFTSQADNLVPDDTNYAYDVFIHGPLIEPEILEVDIDIAWQRFPNQLNFAAGILQVAILSDGTFDTNKVAPDSVRFGPAEAIALRNRVRDIDQDGDDDLLLFFETVKTGITCEDTEATLTGKTIFNDSFTGTDSVAPVNCN